MGCAHAPPGASSRHHVLGPHSGGTRVRNLEKDPQHTRVPRVPGHGDAWVAASMSLQRWWDFQATCPGDWVSCDLLEQAVLGICCICHVCQPPGPSRWVVGLPWWESQNKWKSHHAWSLISLLVNSAGILNSAMWVCCGSVRRNRVCRISNYGRSF